MLALVISIVLGFEGYTASLSAYAANPNPIKTTTTALTPAGRTVNVAAGGFVVNNGVLIFGAGPGGADYIGTVTAINGNTLTINPPTVTAVPRGTNVWVDNTAAFQAMTDSVTRRRAQGARFFLPSGRYLLNGDFNAHNNVWELPESTSAAPITYIFAGECYEQPSEAPMAGGCVTIDVSRRASLGRGAHPSIFAGREWRETTAGVSAFNRASVVFENVNFITGPNPSVTVLNLNNVLTAGLKHVTVSTGEAPGATTEPTNPLSLGIEGPGVNNNSFIVWESVRVIGQYHGFRISEHFKLNDCYAIFCKVGWLLGHGGHVNTGFMGADHCTTNLKIVAGYGNRLDVTLDAENDAGSAWYSSVSDVEDPDNQIHGMIRYVITTAGTGSPRKIVRLGGRAVLAVDLTSGG